MVLNGITPLPDDVVVDSAEVFLRRPCTVLGNTRSGIQAFHAKPLNFAFTDLTVEARTIDDRCAEEYGQIRADLRRQGQPIGPNDMLIAATARAHDAVLVTHNTSEFGRVAGLRMEDWESPDR